jgi:hypothetical protein
MELRYLGFDQQQSKRAYRFKRVANGEPAAFFVVTADLALFLAHHVAIQEGPGLCASKLAADLQETVPRDHELTGSDLLAHTQARATADARKAELRKSNRRG